MSDIVIDIKIGMNKLVSHRNNFTPGNVGMIRSKIIGKLSCCFADYFQGTHNCKSQLPIAGFRKADGPLCPQTEHGMQASSPVNCASTRYRQTETDRAGPFPGGAPHKH